MGTVGDFKGFPWSWRLITKVVLFVCSLVGLVTIVFLWLVLGFSPGTIIAAWSPFINEVNNAAVITLLIGLVIRLFFSLSH